jgi:dipeptidyl aminopeptidase/acylaminoacyl peptidase
LPGPEDQSRRPRPPRPEPCGNRLGGGGGREIYVLNTDGTGLRRLTDNGAVQDDDPQWSPDGRQIAFVRTEPDRRSEIFVMNSDGSGQTNISRHPANDEAPAWQPLTTSTRGVLPETGANLVPALIIGIVVLSAGVASRAVGRHRTRRAGRSRENVIESTNDPEPAPSQARPRPDRAPVERPG